MQTLFVSIMLVSSLTIVTAQSSLKTNDTAYPVGWRNGEVSIFQDGRYGISRKGEINTHPLLFFAMPHVHYKQYWTSFELFNKDIAFASRHGAYYPTILLNFTRNQAFIPEDFRASEKAPHTVGFNNQLLFSTFLKSGDHCDYPDHLLTLRLGAKYAFNTDTSLRPVINKAVFHRESTVLHPKFIWHAQASLTGHLGIFLHYYFDAGFHSYAYNVEHFSAESKIGIYGNIGRQSSLFGGLKTVYTNQPEIKTLSFYPLINLYYTFKRSKKGPEKGLWKKDPFNFNEM